MRRRPSGGFHDGPRDDNALGHIFPQRHQQFAGERDDRGLARLRALYLADFLPVSRVRAGQFAVPKDFEELMPHIAKVISKVTVSQDPVMVVNGDKEMASEDGF